MFKVKDIRKEIPTIDEWRLGLLEQLLVQRWEMDICGEELEVVSSLINSLCSS